MNELMFKANMAFYVEPKYPRKITLSLRKNGLDRFHCILILFSDGASFNDLDTFSLLNSDDMTAVMTENMKYMQRKGK